MDGFRNTLALACMAIIVGVALPAVTMLGATSPTGATVGPFGSAHNHIHLFFLTNGTEKVMTEPYIEQARKAHFHAADGILHVEATGVTLGYALTALNVSLTAECIRFGPGNTSYCTGEANEVRVAVNGEERPVEEALDRVLEQGDAIAVYHGPRNATIPREYTDKLLPDRYRPGIQGDPV